MATKPRIGLALGAGGTIGWPFHLGVLEGLEAVTGLGPADLVALVGTSAGGAIAASARGGASTEEILASVNRPITDADRQRMMEAGARPGRRPRLPFIGRPQAPGLIRRGGAVGLVGALPAGAFPTFPLRRFPLEGLADPGPDTAAHPDTAHIRWPGNLWLPAVRLDDGKTVVFGRDRTDVDVADAVEATSAVPLLFRPKVIGDERFVDGAVASATHLDLFTPLSPELVVIASPMTRPGRGPVKARARRQLAAERARLDAAGIRTVLIEPDAELVALADGYPRHRPDAGPAVVAAARALTEAALAAVVAPERRAA
ncbi:MAG: patatin-like phospholipase family protein [Actinomycetota bacterium]